MNIQYISDIHLELMSPNEYIRFIKAFPIKANILVLAGDIGNPYHHFYTNFLDYVSHFFTKVFIIAGNHEFYGNEIEQTIKKIQEITKDYSNITFLHNSFEDYEGVRWIGTTQWTPITNPAFTINDTKMIHDMTIERYNALHQESKEFLEYTLQSCVDESKKSIVITHHLPIPELVLPQYKTPYFAPYNQWFHANLHDIISEYNKSILGWFYGHTHKGSVQSLFGISFFCSPKGYPGENADILALGNVTTLSIPK